MPNLQKTTARGELMLTLPAAAGTLPIHLVEDPRAPEVVSSIGPSDPGPQRVLIDDLSLGAGYADRKRPGTFSHGRRVWARDGRTVMPAGLVTDVNLSSVATGAAKGSIKDAFEVNSHTYFVGGRYAYQIPNGTGPTPLVAADLGQVGSFDALSARRLAGRVFVGGTGVGIWRYNPTTDSWNHSTDAIKPLLAGAYWVVDGVGGWRMVGTNADNTAFTHVLLSADPLSNANWNPAAPTPLGEQTFPCRSIVTLEDTVYFVCSNGVMLVDARGNNTRNITPSWLQEYDDNNGFFSMPFNGSLLLGHYLGLQQLYTRGPLKHTPHRIGPGDALGFSNNTPIFGRPTAGCQHGVYALVSFYDGNNSWVMSGKEVSEGTWVWFGSECDFPGEKVTFLFISNLASATGAPRLWIASEDTANAANVHLRWQSLPKWSTPLQDLTNAGPMRFSTSFEFYYGSLEWDDVTARKSLIGWDLVSNTLTPATTVAVSAAPDAAAYELQLIGQAGAYTTGGPANPTTSGQRVAVKLDGVGTTTAPPVVYGLGAWATVKRRQFLDRTYRAMFATRTANTNTATDPADPANQLDALLALAGTDAGGGSDPVTAIDHLGNTWIVQVVNGVRLEDDEQAGGPLGKPAYQVTATFTVRFLDRIVRYDTGFRYDTAAVYGSAAGV